MGRPHPCAVKGCVPKDSKRFSFPRSIWLAEIWKKLCENPKLDRSPVEKLNNRFFVCRKHFARHQFQNDLMERLNQHSIPSLFLPSSSSNDTIQCASSDISDDVSVPLDSVVVVDVIVPSENFSRSKGMTPENSKVRCFDNTIPQLGSAETVTSHAVADTENHSDRTLPLVNAINHKDLTIVGDSEKLSSQMLPLPVSGDGTDDSCDEADDFCENAPSPAPDTHPCPQVLLKNLVRDNSFAESSTTEKSLPIINDYYRYSLCRLCFSSSDTLISIFEKSLGYEFLISDAIEDLLQFKVSKADDFPHFICFGCLEKLADFKKFKDELCKHKERFEESLHKLRKRTSEDGSGNDKVGGQSDCQGVEDPEDSKDADSVKNTSELNEMSGDEVSEFNEECSWSADGLTDIDDSGWDRFDKCEAIQQKAEVKENELQEEYKCYECGKVFEFKNVLLTHYEEHRKEWKFACEYCDKRFKTLMKLNCHIIVHSDYKPYECEHCGLRCRLKTTLAKHKLVHSDVKPFLCTVCGMNFRESSQFNLHMKMHSHLKGYKCLECGEEFSSSVKLKKHCVRHEKEKPHVCGDCGKSFSFRYKLNNHVTCVHQKEKRFKCGICSKLFSLRLYLKNHMKIHKRSIT